jgi:hypothetical protein
MYDKAHNQINNWRCDNPHIFGDQVDQSNPQTTSSGKVQRTSQRFSWESCDDLRAIIQPPSCRHYKPGEFLAIQPLKWDEIIDEVNDIENLAVPGTPNGGSSRPGDGTDSDDAEGE